MSSISMVRGLMAAVLVAFAVAARADVLNMPSGQTSLQFVTVGDAGNAADPATGSSYGAVPYAYQIGRYDVTLAQYTAFLNAVAQTDTYGLYNSLMGTDFPTLGISQSGSAGSYSYSVTGSAPGAANMPVFDETWGDAARFCNWLQNGQGTAANVGQAYALTETGAYALNRWHVPGATYGGGLARAQRRSCNISCPRKMSGTKPHTTLAEEPPRVIGPGRRRATSPPDNSLVLAGTSTNDANYYNSGYTDPTNYLTPVGTFAASPVLYGTYDMGGDLFQWNETNIGGSSARVAGRVVPRLRVHPGLAQPRPRRRPHG